MGSCSTSRRHCKKGPTNNECVVQKQNLNNYLENIKFLITKDILQIMLPHILNGERGFDSENQDDFEKYLLQIGHFKNVIDHDFLKQICIDFFTDFNEKYPYFDIGKYKITRLKMTTQEIYDMIRYGENDKLDFWYEDFDRYNKEYIPDEEEEKYLFNYMRVYTTWPISPVVVDNRKLLCKRLGFKNGGKPLHLVEGTHRISYLNRMLEIKIIDPKSEHEILMITET